MYSSKPVREDCRRIPEFLRAVAASAYKVIVPVMLSFCMVASSPCTLEELVISRLRFFVEPKEFSADLTYF